MSDFKFPTEAELMSTLLLPLVGKMGFARATAALEYLKPAMEKFTALKETDAQLVEDVLTVVHDWSGAILDLKVEDKAA